MIRSMTGYAAAEETQGQVSVGVEIRSYNSRNLDIALRLSTGYLSLEDKIKSLIPRKMSRGRIEITVRVVDDSETAIRYEVHTHRAKAYYHALCRLCTELGLEGRPSLEHILRVGDIITPGGSNDSAAESAWPAVERCVHKTLDLLNRMRETEGNFISSDFLQRLEVIGVCLEQIEARTEGLLPIYQERLKERMGVLTGGLVDIDPARIAQEAAFLADKSDISEEITRSKSHISQFRIEMDSELPAGRKLNFLLQEFNREFNTMGSKAANSEVSYLVVTVKTELEKLREQVQNIE
jgi:uncharacterized protein (TIGR00255 family)